MLNTNIKKELKLIQLLRCVACLLVVMFHISGNYSNTYLKSFLGNSFKFGGAGVDIFFVLSGFIITYSNRNYLLKKSNAIQFLKKRIIRIFPIYWVILSFFLLIQLALPSFYQTHYIISIPNLLKTYLLLPNHNMINGVSWTLTNELFFYLIFTIAFIIPNKKYLLSLLFIYLAFLTISPMFNFVNSNTDYNKNLHLFPMNIEFLLGIVIVLLVDRFHKKYCLPFLFVGICLFIVSALFTNSSHILFPSAYNRVVLFGLPSFLIILSLVKYELTHDIIIPKLFLKLGDASYSIYLFHLPLVAAFFKITFKLHVTNTYTIFILICGLLVAICYLGIILFKKVETPLIKWLNSVLIKS